MISLTLVLGKVMAFMGIGSISKDIQDKEEIESTQQGSRKGKSCLINLIALSRMRLPAL